jgi:hypothetical protein
MVIRMAIAENRDIAELMTAGFRGESALDAADELRLEQLLQENTWAAFHIWDRTQRGIFPKGTFEATGCWRVLARSVRLGGSVALHSSCRECFSERRTDVAYGVGGCRKASTFFTRESPALVAHGSKPL